MLEHQISDRWIVRESQYRDGEALCNQGERGITAFLIVSGSVRIENELDDGTVVEVTELGQGTMVGELSVVDGAERVATVRAIGEVQTLVLTQWSMMALFKSRPTIASAMLPIIVKRFRETAEELRHQDRESPPARHSVYQ